MVKKNRKILFFICTIFLFQSCSFFDLNIGKNEIIRPATVDEAKKAITGKWQQIAQGPSYDKEYEQFWHYQDFNPDGGYMELLPDGDIRYFNPETGEYRYVDRLEEFSFGYTSYSIDKEYLYLYMDFLEEDNLARTWSFKYELTKNQLKLYAVVGLYTMSMGSPRIFIYQLIK